MSSTCRVSWTSQFRDCLATLSRLSREYRNYRNYSLILYHTCCVSSPLPPQPNDPLSSSPSPNSFTKPLLRWRQPCGYITLPLWHLDPIFDDSPPPPLPTPYPLSSYVRRVLSLRIYTCAPIPICKLRGYDHGLLVRYLSPSKSHFR